MFSYGLLTTTGILTTIIEPKVVRMEGNPAGRTSGSGAAGRGVFDSGPAAKAEKPLEGQGGGFPAYRATRVAAYGCKGTPRASLRLRETSGGASPRWFFQIQNFYAIFRRSSSPSEPPPVPPTSLFSYHALGLYDYQWLQKPETPVNTVLGSNSSGNRWHPNHGRNLGVNGCNIQRRKANAIRKLYLRHHVTYIPEAIAPSLALFGLVPGQARAIRSSLFPSGRIFL